MSTATTIKKFHISLDTHEEMYEMYKALSARIEVLRSSEQFWRERFQQLSAQEQDKFTDHAAKSALDTYQDLSIRADGMQILINRFKKRLYIP